MVHRFGSRVRCVRCSCGKVIHGDCTPIATTIIHETDMPSSFYTRRAICKGCKFKVKAGCILYIKPCTVKALWHDQVPPPTQCPNKEKFDE